MLQHDQVDGDEREKLREHLDQEQGHHPHTPALEPEAAEGVRGQRAEEDAEEGRGRPG